MLAEQIGNNIKYLRQEQSMTQNALADVLHVSHQMISRYENGLVLPDVEMLVKICEIFHVTLDRLCGLDELSKEGRIRCLSEKYSEGCSGTFSMLEQQYNSFLMEAEPVLGEDRVMKIQLSLLETLHDNIETNAQHRDINEKIWECASRILDVSRDDKIRSSANLRMAIYYSETPFDSPDYDKNLLLARAYSEKVLLGTWFPDYTPILGLDMRTDAYTKAKISNMHFYIRKAFHAICHLDKRGEPIVLSESYKKIAGLLKDLIEQGNIL